MPFAHLLLIDIQVCKHLFLKLFAQTSPTIFDTIEINLDDHHSEKKNIEDHSNKHRSMPKT